MATKAKKRNIVPTSYERIHVECYSGHKANERPVAFIYEGRRREVEEIVDRWYEGGVDPGWTAIFLYSGIFPCSTPGPSAPNARLALQAPQVENAFIFFFYFHYSFAILWDKDKKYYADK